MNKYERENEWELALRVRLFCVHVSGHIQKYVNNNKSEFRFIDLWTNCNNNKKYEELLLKTHIDRCVAGQTAQVTKRAQRVFSKLQNPIIFIYFCFFLDHRLGADLLVFGNARRLRSNSSFA